MNNLLQFLCRLEKHNIHYYLEHNRDEFIMVCIAIPGERWEVEFSSNGDVEFEIFKNSEGVFTNEKQLEDIFTVHEGTELQINIAISKSANPNVFFDKFVSEAIEGNGLAVGGNPLSDDGCVVSMYDRGFVSEEQRLSVEQWLIKQPEIIKSWVKELGNK